jgi:hypothetical protein
VQVGEAGGIKRGEEEDKGNLVQINEKHVKRARNGIFQTFE